MKLTIVLDKIRSAYNVGSVMRTAACFDADEIVTVGFTPDAEHKKVKKTSLGAEKMLRVTSESSLETYLSERKDTDQFENIFAIEIADSAQNLWKKEFNFDQRITVILGNEIDGLDLEIIEKYGIEIVQIPMPGPKQSINIASAAAIIIHELARQYHA